MHPVVDGFAFEFALDSFWSPFERLQRGLRLERALGTDNRVVEKQVAQTRVPLHNSCVDHFNHLQAGEAVAEASAVPQHVKVAPAAQLDFRVHVKVRQGGQRGHGRKERPQLELAQQLVLDDQRLQTDALTELPAGRLTRFSTQRQTQHETHQQLQPTRGQEAEVRAVLDAQVEQAELDRSPSFGAKWHHVQTLVTIHFCHHQDAQVGQGFQ